MHEIFNLRKVTMQNFLHPINMGSRD